MNILTQLDMAVYENAPPPQVEQSNFLVSFRLLPAEERVAMHTIYSFCAYIDDIVDSTENLTPDDIERKNERLNWWEDVIDKIFNGKVDSPLIEPLHDTINRFAIPRQYFHTLINGCRRDLLRDRYQTFDELKKYCYGVASVVGLMSIEVFGYKHEETKNYAINLGYALQLTNIIRDVHDDFSRGYIYLPLEDMERFNYTEEDLAAKVYNNNFIDLMRYQANRARSYYYKARTNLSPDEKSTLFPAEIMDAVYYRLLEKIELKRYNVFEGKIRVSRMHKVMILLKHWVSLKLFVSRFTPKYNSE